MKYQVGDLLLVKDIRPRARLLLHLDLHLLLHEDDGDEVRQDERAVPLGDDGTLLSLDPAHRGVGVEADDEPVPQRAGLQEVLDVPPVEDVEDPVGEDHWPVALERCHRLLDVQGVNQMIRERGAGVLNRHGLR